MVLGTKRRVNFIYNSAYYQLLADITAYLEEQGLEPNQDFMPRDNGHTLEIDGEAHFDIKECPKWQSLTENYEEVGCVVVRSLR
jgi:hypothetical protein